MDTDEHRFPEALGHQRPTAQQLMAQEVRDVSIFCVERIGKCFQNWSGEKIYKFIAWHLMNNTLFVVRDNGVIKAVGVAWSGEAEDFTQRHATNVPQFDWTARNFPCPGPDLLVSTVFGDRKYCAELWQMGMKKFKLGPEARIFTYRHFTFHEFKRSRLERFFREHS